LIGMCKALNEMQEKAVDRRTGGRDGGGAKAEGCAPIVKPGKSQSDSAEFFPNAATMAFGIARCRGPLAQFADLAMLRQTMGSGAEGFRDEMLQRGSELGLRWEIFSGARGAATVIGARKLRLSG